MDEHEDEPGRAPTAAGDDVPARDPDEARRRRGAVGGGLLLGLLLGFLVIPYLTFVLVSSLPGSTDLGLALALAVPGVVGLLLLVPRGTRQAGAGALLGVALGLIVGSATCVGWFSVAISSYTS